MGFFSGRMWFFPPFCLYDLLRHDRGPKRRSPAHKAPFPFFIPFYGPCPSREAFVFITGLLCGYPMGARMDSRFLEEGRIELNEPERFLPSATTPAPCLSWVISAFRPHPFFLLQMPVRPGSFSPLCICHTSGFFSGKKCYHLNQEASLCRQDNYKSEHTRVP